MQQIVLEQPGTFKAREIPPPTSVEGRALVRVRRIGVCGTDLHAFAGRQPFFEYPRVLGHELGVEVMESGGRPDLQPGSLCAIEPYLSCGACRACAAGRSNCCETLAVLGVHHDGGMQPLLSVPPGLLHRSDALSADQLALVETLGIGAHAVRRSGVQSGQRALVLGAGPIGLAVVQFAKATGAEIQVVDLSESRRRFAERFGVAALAEPEAEPYDVVFDATGSRTSMEASLEYVGAGGKWVWVGLVLDRVAIDDPSFHRKEVTLLASRNSAGLFPQIIRMIENGEIDTTPWITHRLALGSVPDEFAGLREQPDLIKAMIEVEDDA